MDAITAITLQYLKISEPVEESKARILFIVHPVAERVVEIDAQLALAAVSPEVDGL
jgi:hypothetical protein